MKSHVRPTQSGCFIVLDDKRFQLSIKMIQHAVLALKKPNENPTKWALTEINKKLDETADSVIRNNKLNVRTTQWTFSLRNQSFPFRTIVAYLSGYSAPKICNRAPIIYVPHIDRYAHKYMSIGKWIIIVRYVKLDLYSQSNGTWSAHLAEIGLSFGEIEEIPEKTKNVGTITSWDTLETLSTKKQRRFSTWMAEKGVKFVLSPFLNTSVYSRNHFPSSTFILPKDNRLPHRQWGNR